jgi:hypothetical protein
MGKPRFCHFAHFRVLSWEKVSTDVMCLHSIPWKKTRFCSILSLLRFWEILTIFPPRPNTTYLTVELLGDPPSIPEVAFIHRVRIPDVYETDIHGSGTPVWPLHHSVSSPPFSLLRCPHLAYVCPHIRLMREPWQKWLGIARVHVHHSLWSVAGCMGPPDHAFDHTYMMALTAWSAKTPTCGLHGWMGPQRKLMGTGWVQILPNGIPHRDLDGRVFICLPDRGARFCIEGCAHFACAPGNWARLMSMPTHSLWA